MALLGPTHRMLEADPDNLIFSRQVPAYGRPLPELYAFAVSLTEEAGHG